MSHKLVSLYIGDGEYYTRIDADAVIAELKKEIESMKVKFREFNDNVCKKIVEA